MAEHIVDALFEDEKDLATQIGAELDVSIPVRCAKLKLNVARSKNIAGKTPHALRQIAQVIFCGLRPERCRSLASTSSRDDLAIIESGPLGESSRPVRCRITSLRIEISGQA